MIVISEFMSEQAVSEGLKDHRVLYDPTLVDRPDDLAEALREATGLIVRNRTQVRGALLAAAPLLKVVGRLGVGLDNIDTPACEARGIKVYPASGANDVSVA
jgi:(S)-sulfolactate dehydrogenase